MAQPDSHEHLEVTEPEVQLGRYRVVADLAAGGMASVHLALETEGLGRLVALKTMHPHLCNEPSYVEMFLDEARINAAVDHRNVCKVYDFGQAEGRYFIAMEPLSGHTIKELVERLRRSGRPADYVPLVVQMVASACEGLHAAHELRDHDERALDVVHRDVSPQNLFLGYDGRLRVVDFGIAHAAGRLQHTSEGVVKGKFGYIAPEQIRGGDIDRRADVWSVGIVLWEMLALQRLFMRSTHADTLMSVMMDPIRPPSELAGEGVPRELDAVVLRALSRDREERFATAQEMATALRSAARSAGLPERNEANVAGLLQGLFQAEQEARRALMNDARQLARGVAGLGPLSAGSSSAARAQPRTSGVVPRARGGGDASEVRVRRSRSAIPPLPPSSESNPDSALELEIDTETETPTHDRARALKWAVVAAVAVLAVVAGLLSDGQEAPAEAPSASLAAVGDRAKQAVDPTAGKAASSASGTPAATARKPAEADRPAPTEAEPVETAAPEGPAEPEAQAAHESTRARSRGRSSRHGHKGVASARHKAAPSGGDGHAGRPDRSGAAPAEEAAPLPEVETSGAEAAHGDPRGGTRPADAPQPEEPADRGEGVTERSAPTAPQAESAPASQSDTAAPEPAPRAEQTATPVAKPEPAPKPPPFAPRDAAVQVRALDVRGPLITSTVSRMLDRANADLARCYETASVRARRHDTKPLSASFTIDEMGATRGVRVSPHDLPGLSGCAATALKRLRSSRRPDTGRAQVSLKLDFALR